MSLNMEHIKSFSMAASGIFHKAVVDFNKNLGKHITHNIFAKPEAKVGRDDFVCVYEEIAIM